MKIFEGAFSHQQPSLFFSLYFSFSSLNSPSITITFSLVLSSSFLFIFISLSLPLHVSYGYLSYIFWVCFPPFSALPGSPLPACLITHFTSRQFPLTCLPRGIRELI